MESTVEIRRSKLLPKLFAISFLCMSLWVGSNVVQGGRCDKDWASMYACFGGNRRSLPDDATEPRGNVDDWNRFPGDSTSLERAARSSSMDHDENLDTSRLQTKNLNSIRTDDDSFGDRFEPLRQPKFSDVARAMKSFGLRSLVGSLAQPDYGARYGWSGRTPWSLDKRLAAAAGWKRSLASNDVSLDAAISRVKDLMARKQLLQKWLMQVDEDGDYRR